MRKNANKMRRQEKKLLLYKITTKVVSSYQDAHKQATKKIRKKWKRIMKTVDPDFTNQQRSRLRLLSFTRLHRFLRVWVKKLWTSVLCIFIRLFISLCNCSSKISILLAWWDRIFNLTFKITKIYLKFFSFLLSIKYSLKTHINKLCFQKSNINEKLKEQQQIKRN